MPKKQPSRATSRKASRKATPRKGKVPEDAIDYRLIKAFGHPLRTRILSVLNRKIASPTGLAEELNSKTGHTAYHIKVLKEIDFVELVDTAQRRGATEHFYRATRRALIRPEVWERLPAAIQGQIATDTFQLILDDAGAALQADAYSKRPDSHVSWTPMTVDKEGWTAFIALLEDTLDGALEIQAKAAARMSKEDGEEIPISMALIGYESARSDGKGKK